MVDFLFGYLNMVSTACAIVIILTSLGVYLVTKKAKTHTLIDKSLPKLLKESDILVGIGFITTIILRYGLLIHSTTLMTMGALIWLVLAVDLCRLIKNYC